MFKKNSIFVAIVLSLAVIFAGGCFGGSDSKKKTTDTADPTYTNQNLPTDFQVTIPKSLKSSGAKKKTLKDSLSAKMTRVTSGESSSGYAQLKQMVSDMELFAGEIKIQFMFIDAFWSLVAPSLTATGGSVSEGAYSIAFTQEMANTMISYETDGLDPAVDQAYIDMITAGYNSMVGMEFPCPALTIALDPSDTDNDGYNFSVTYSFGNTVAKKVRNVGLKSDLSTSSDSTVIKWNTAKTLVSITYTYDMSDPTFGTFSGSSKFVYDSSTKKLTYKGSDEFFGIQSTYSFTFEETGSANGIKIAAGYTFKDSTYPTSGYRYSYDIEGIADDNGGYILATMKFDDAVTFDTIYYKELFDGSGNLTGWAISTDNVNWITEAGYSDPTSGSYDDTTYTITDVITVNVTIPGTETTEFSFVILPTGITYDALNTDPFYAAMIGSGIMPRILIHHCGR